MSCQENIICHQTRPKGTIQMIVRDLSGAVKEIHRHNTVLRKGREALASSLSNEIGSTYDFYIARMLFGDGGTSGSVPKFVNTDRNGLFGITRSIKPIISTIDPNLKSQVVFTSVLDYDEANGFALNEMALQMNNGNLYSMATFADLSKTSAIQIVFNWRLSFI